MRKFLRLSALVALALGGCELAPDYAPPIVALPTSFTDAGSGGAPTRGEWWLNFKDSRLNALESQVDAANPNLGAALGAFQAARARADQAVAGLFPQVDFSGDLSADKQSANRPLRSKSQPTFYGANQVGAGVASYELDIWGRVSDLVKATKIESEAARDALADARLALHAELARDFVALRGLDAQAKLLADTIHLYRSALDLTQQRLNAKIAPPIDAERAKTQLANAKAAASDLALRRTALTDAIATLAGKSAAGFTLAAQPAPMTYPRRPRAAPGDVLRLRPDVAEAERQVAAAFERIGAAKANKYPKFSLALFAGAQDTSLRLLDPINTFYSLGPTMSVPLFDAGLRDAEIKEAQAQARIAAELYRATVLRAVREVQDQVSALRWLADEGQQTNIAAASAKKALDMSMALYRDGAASFLDVVTAEDADLAAQRAALAIRARQMDGYVGLVLALGGGWKAPADALAQATP